MESTIEFEEAMENGYVECTMTTCAVTGAAGSGKSHTVCLMLKEDPPDVRQSTGLSEPVRAFSTVVGASSSESGSLKWSKVDEDMLLDIVAGATSVKSAEEQPAVQIPASPLTHSTSEESLSTSLPLDALQDMRTQEQPENSSEVGISEQVSKLEQVSHSEVVDKHLAGATSEEDQPEVPSPPYSTSEESFSTTSLLPATHSSRSDTGSSLPYQAEALSTHTQEQPQSSDTSVQVSKLEQASHTKHVDELLIKLGGLLKKPAGERRVTKLNLLYFLDSGGQPQFHDLLPSFIPNLSTILFVLKLSEKLSQRPVIEFYKEGKSVCSYQSPHSHEQILKHCIRAMQPENRSIESHGSSSPSIAVVGTYRDEESECEGETRDDKNQKLCDLLQPRFGDSLIFYHQLKELIYPVNAKKPDQEDSAVAGKLRGAIIDYSDQKRVKIPLPWFVLEQVLRKLAKERGTGVMHIDECREIAHLLRIKPSAFDSALKYLVSLNVFLHYPTVLPVVVFCVPQVFLDKMNELVQYRHVLCGSCSGILPGSTEPTNTRGLSGKRWLHFRNYGLFQEELLHDKAFSRHYDEHFFTPADFLKLLEYRLIVGKVNTTDIHTEYVMPSLLFELESDKLDEYRCNPQLSPAAPLLVHFPNEWPTSGVFCSLAASLLSAENWEVMTDASKKPTCLYRNCFQFQHPKMPGSITLIDSFDQGYFEVHVDDNAPLEECTKYCPEIRQSVFNALPPKAPVRAEVAFFCPNSKGSTLCPSSLHLAYMKPRNHWSCSENPGKVYGGLAEAPNMRVWGITTTSASGIALLLSVRLTLCICHFSCHSSSTNSSSSAEEPGHCYQNPTVGGQLSEIVEPSKLP